MKSSQLPYGAKFLLTGSALATLSIWTNFFDAFTFPKFVLIFMLAINAVALLFINRKELISLKIYLVGTSVFIGLFLYAVISGDVLHTSLFGVQGRNMGFLSYLSLGIISLVFASWANGQVVSSTLFIFKLTAGVLVLYGCLQAFDIDPFDWNLVYEGIIGNFGNPNFMSVMSGLSAAAFLSVFLTSNKRATAYKLTHLATGSLSLIALYYSKSTQGWLVFAIAMSPLIYVRLMKYGLKIARAFLVAGISLFAFIGIALFNKGPFASFIYQQSLEFRSDFWSIAWRMASANPWNGVGIDRYQNYYREYRTLEQVNRVGAEDFSDSAHNIYLHLAATGGFPLAIAMLALNLYVAYRFIVAIKRITQHQEFIALVFGIWLAIQGQSLISVEYPSISLWSWISAGLGVGISYRGSTSKNPEVALSAKYGGLFATTILLGSSLFYLVPAANAQSSLLKGFYAFVEKGDLEAISTKATFLREMESKDPHNPTLPILSANSLFQDGAYREAAAASRRAIKIDDHDYRSWWFLASSLESIGNREKAIPARLKTIELSPYNSQNLLELAKNYQAAQDAVGLEQVLKDLKEINPNSNEYLEASKLTIP